MLFRRSESYILKNCKSIVWLTTVRGGVVVFIKCNSLFLQVFKVLISLNTCFAKDACSVSELNFKKKSHSLVLKIVFLSVAASASELVNFQHFKSNKQPDHFTKKTK